jgi:hypothetical protein
MFILAPGSEFFYPESHIPILGQKDPESRIHIKRIKLFLIQKPVSKLSEKLSWKFFPDPDFFLIRITDPDPQHCLKEY